MNFKPDGQNKAHNKVLNQELPHLMRESESEISESVVSYPLQIATPPTNLEGLPSLPSLENSTQMTDSAFDSIDLEAKLKHLEKS